MGTEISTKVVSEQQEVVLRYATQIKEVASSGNRRIAADGRRCYELLNECAMELSKISRQIRMAETPAQ